MIFLPVCTFGVVSYPLSRPLASRVTAHTHTPGGVPFGFMGRSALQLYFQGALSGESLGNKKEAAI